MTEPEKHLFSGSRGAHPVLGRGLTERAPRVALVLSLCALSTPAHAQWFDEPTPVRAADAEPAPPPPPASEPATPAPATPAPPAPSAAPAPEAPPAAEASAPANAQAPSAAAAQAPTPPSAGPEAEAEGPSAASWALRFRVAASAEAAFGLDNRFRNYLFGPRLDLRFADQTAIGYAVRYANLRGREDRAHNALHTITIEHRLFPREGTGFAVPVRMTGGYLPKNGPFLQAAGGAGYVGERVELLVLPLMPTFWNTGNKTWVSFDVALEVGIRL